MQFETKIIKTEIGDVEYTDVGDGPPIIFSHGSPGGADMGPLIFNKIINKNFRLITPSRPGYMNTNLDLGKTPEEQAKLFYHFINAMNIEKPSLLAWSGGGPLALNFAINYPERISSLVMLSAVSQRFDENNPLFKLFIKSDFFSRAFLSMKKKLPFLNNLLCQELGVNPASIFNSCEKLTILDSLVRMTTPSCHRVYGYENDIEQFSLLKDFDYHKVTCPTLILFHEKDTQVPVEHGNSLSEKIPHSVYMKFEKGGHVPMVDEDSDLVNEHITSFFRKHI